MFLLVCILTMWLMIFGLAFSYLAVINHSLWTTIIYRYTLVIVVTCLAWFLGAYFLTFEQRVSTIFSLTANLDKTRISQMLFQLCFCLYAVLMFIGAAIDRIQTKNLLLLVFSWVFLVYCPLAFLIWNKDSFLFQLGVLDFSGGLVVHLAAGLSALVLAKQVKQKPITTEKNDDVFQFWGMIFISFGWFGFNMGPAGGWNNQAALVLLNTLLAIIIGGSTWTILSYYKNKKEITSSLLDGVIVGLVTSTAGVGYVNTLQMVIICGISSLITYLFTTSYGQKFAANDSVNSFAINGIGGFCGSIFLVVLLPKHFWPQVIAILLTGVIAIVGTFILTKLFIRR